MPESVLADIEMRTAWLIEAYPYLHGLDSKWCRKIEEEALRDFQPLVNTRVSDIYLAFPELFDKIFEKEYVVNCSLKDSALTYIDRFVCKISRVTAVGMELSGRSIGLTHLAWVSVPNTEFHYAIIPQKILVREAEWFMVKCFEPFNIDLRPAGVCVHRRFLGATRSVELLPSQANMVKHKLMS